MKRRHQGLTFVAVAAILTVGGCQKSLFVKGSERTQYERYQSLRGEYRPQKQTTPLGREEPALRQRLAPLDQD